MANNKYQKLIRQYSDDGVTWYNLDPIAYKVGELLEENSYCQARIYREITGDTSSIFDCDENGNKYEMILFQYSDNNGTTWVTYDQQRGNRLENLSEDCGVEYRWIKVLPIETDYICEGTNKYYRIQGEYTINGTDWYTVNQYQKGDLYETKSEDCGYNPDSSGGTSSDELAFEFSGTTMIGNAQYRINDVEYIAYTSPFSTSLADLGVTEWTSAEDMFYDRRIANSTVTKITSIPDTSTVTNMRGMFYCTQVQTLDLSHFNTSNVTNMGSIFRDCNNLTSLDLSNFDTSNVTNMGQMFYGSDKLTSLDLSSFDTSNVTNMSEMFSGCDSLTSLDLSNFDTSNVTDMSAMFPSGSGLTSLNLSNWDTSQVTEMQGMFSGWYSLTSTTQIIGFENFNTSNVRYMHQMFQNCSGLTSLDLSHFNTSNVTSMRWIFKGCKSLETLDISGWDIWNVTGTFDFFTNCDSLEKIYMYGCSSYTISAIQDTLTDAGIREQVTIIT